MRRVTFIAELPNGRTTNYVIEGTQALVGSSGHCEIRLPAEAGAAPEQLSITIIENVIRARALTHNPAALMNGSAFTEVLLTNECVLSIGRVRLQVVEDSEPSTPRTIEQPSLLTRRCKVLAALGLGAIGYVALSGSAPGTGLGVPAESAPNLWGSLAPSCPEQDPAPAYLAGLDALRLAQAHAERRPFKIQAGVRSLANYKQSIACFQASGEASLAHFARAESAPLERELNTEYRARRLHLEHALASGEQATAQAEVEALLAFLEGQQGPYVAWLSELRRRFHLEQGKTQR